MTATQLGQLYDIYSIIKIMFSGKFKILTGRMLTSLGILQALFLIRLFL